MKVSMRPYQGEQDYWRIRNFLREVFLLYDRARLDCHVALLDHWRWHYVLTCQETAPVDQVTTLWETPTGQVAAVLHPICHDEISMYVHPDLTSQTLEDEMIAFAEIHHSDWTAERKRILYVPVYDQDAVRKETLVHRGFRHRPRRIHHWQRDLEQAIPELPLPSSYGIRSMGAADELPARNWASWRAFHAEEPDENFDDDYSWYRNMQSAPLYRRDLDVVAVTPAGEIASFCTISYDDYSRSGVIVLEGTAAEHRHQGLEQALTIEGMRRLKSLGCTLIFAIADDESTEALYRSTMQSYRVVQQWVKIWDPPGG